MSDRRAPFPPLLVLLGTLLLLGPGTTAQSLAGETLLEGFSTSRKFAPLWPGGTFEQSTRNGLSWLRVVTDGQGNATFLANVRPYRPALDLTGKFLKVWIKVDDITNLRGMEFRLSSDRFGEDFFAFSFPIYDDEDTNVVRDGVWTTITLGFGSARVEGSPDRSAINSLGWYVADKGGENPVTAHLAGIAAVDQPPEGVVSLTFDDGYDEHHLAAKLMSEYGFRGTAYVIPEAIGRRDYMSLHQLVDLQDRYGWEVASHHVTPFTDLRPDELEDTILGIQRYLVDNGLGRGAQHLAYPLGRQNTSVVRPLVRKHFASARVAGGLIETLPPADPHLLRAFNVVDTTTPEEVGVAAHRARENGEWLILMLHWLVEEANFSTAYSIDDFKQMLEVLKRSKVRVLPLGEVLQSCTGGLEAMRCELPARPASPSR